MALKTTSINSLILCFFKYPTISVKITSVSIYASNLKLHQVCFKTFALSAFAPIGYPLYYHSIVYNPWENTYICYRNIGKRLNSVNVNRVKIGKNILRGILGPRRARGVSRGRGWGAPLCVCALCVWVCVVCRKNFLYISPTPVSALGANQLFAKQSFSE